MPDPSGKPRAEDLANDLTNALQASVAQLVPRFLETMPPAYFHDTDTATQLDHLKALLAAAASGLPQDLTLRSNDGRTVTFIRESSYPGLLAEIVERLPDHPPLSGAKVHTATDGSLILDTFELGEPTHCDPDDPTQAAAMQRTIEVLATHGGHDSNRLRQHLTGCAADYIRRVPPERVADHYQLLQRLYASDLCEVQIEPVPGTPLHRIAIASPTREGRDLFARLAGFLGKRNVDIHQAHVDLFRSPSRVAAILTVLVVIPDKINLERLTAALSRLRYLDDSVLRLWHQAETLGLVESEILVALGRLAHQRLTREDHLLFTRDRIEATIAAHVKQVEPIASQLLARLRQPDASVTLEPPAGDEVTVRILTTLQELAQATRRCNALVPQRRALALRLEGDALAAPNAPEVPFGIFFVHGRDFDGFHVRFRDIARGGIRIVRPRGPEQYALESERIYEEAFNLAYAQQLKNKDIPEGGAKGVILTAPDTDPEPPGRAYADGLLDLIAPDARTAALVNQPAQPELLYLGPDENITNNLINWIVERARQRDYPLPTALMSSKPDAGINHKEFGVTSEGVTVFLEVALQYIGIDPRKQSFTVTLTGGPDGDVAGNEIRILAREYGDNARICGIADGSGSAEDPDGLNQQELLRLVDQEQPIAAFDPTKLGPRGRVLQLSSDGGLSARNTLHNRLTVDALIPAGGRPATIHADNWRDFLNDDGQPVARLIVEGANLFLTPEARTALSDAGVLIVKDSSANKCGVICSSLEILACMLLDEDRFMQIKSEFVVQVLDQLRRLARREAEALFFEKRCHPEVPLPRISEQLSLAINRVTDTLAEQLPGLRSAHANLASTLLGQHLPPILLGDNPGTVLEQLPSVYVNRALASLLGGRLVYREGLSLVAQMTDTDLRDLARRYLLQELQTSTLAERVAASDLPDRERMADLLREGGTRAALRLPNQT